MRSSKQREWKRPSGIRMSSHLARTARTRSCKVCVVALVAGLMLFPLAGCSSGTSADSAGSNDGVITDIPPIYVEQTVVVVDNGVPVTEHQYREALANCQHSPFPVRPLAAEDVAKIGRTFHKQWFEGKRWAAQTDTWTYASPKPCQFQLVHVESTRGIDTGKTGYSIDLLKGTAEQSPSDGGGRAALTPGDDQLDPEAARLGEQRLGYAEAVGQPCLRWRDPSGGESCTWSGGYKWGFPRGDSSDEAPSYGHAEIALWVKPANGNGPELTTHKMTVGAPIDDKVFKLHSNIAVGKAD